MENYTCRFAGTAGILPAFEGSQQPLMISGVENYTYHAAVGPAPGVNAGAGFEGLLQGALWVARA